MFFRAGEGIRESFQWHSHDADKGEPWPGASSAPRDLYGSTFNPWLGTRFCLWLLLLLGGFGVQHSLVWLHAWIPFQVGSVSPALQSCFEALLALRESPTF